MAVELLSKYRRLKSSNIEEARAHIGGLLCQHQVHAPASDRPAPTTVNHIALGAISLTWFDCGRPLFVAPQPLDRFYALQIVFGGGERIGDGREHIYVGEGEASIASPTEQIFMESSADCRKLVVRIDRAMLERFAEALLDAPLPAPLLFTRRVPWADASLAACRAALRAILADLEGEARVASHPRAMAAYGDAICAGLLLGQPSSLSAHLTKAASPAADRAVTRVEAFIRAHADAHIAVDDLIAASGVSARTLFANFRRFRGLTPMQALKRFRLAQVRTALLHPNEETSVAKAATAWRFEQLGRFAGEYKAAYGESPSETLRARRLFRPARRELS